MLRLIPAISAICLLPFALVACGDPSSTTDPRLLPPLVRTATVISTASTARAFTGVVVARIQSEPGFRVQGKILARFVDTGQQVKQGQPLMRLDPVDFNLQAQAQQQAVAAASARARQTASDEIRYKSLVSTGAVSASSYSQMKAAADTARAELSAALAQAKVAQNAMSYTLLLADTDGVVMDILAQPGQVVSAGQPVIRLAQAGQREAIVQLPETLRPAPGSEAQASLYGNVSPPVPATLRLLSDAADPVTRTFEARYVLGGALAGAPLGATVTVRIAQKPFSPQALRVPSAAIYDPGKGAGVWRISGTPATVTWQPVHVVGLEDDTATVAGGLKPGEQVVALGAHLLHDGEVVRLSKPAPDAVSGAAHE